MLKEAVYHRPGECWAYGYDPHTVHLRLRTSKGDRLAVQVLYGDKCTPWAHMLKAEMKHLSSDELFDYWQAEVHPPYGRLSYGFVLIEGSERVWYTERGFHQSEPKEHLGLFEFPFLHPIDVHTPPEWVKESVFYQIFPERFANGDTDNDPGQTERWGGKPSYTNFFGGDLQGVRDHLDHLTELGVNAIYFTPIFESPTNHKYDTRDYYRVDPHFGTTDTLRDLVKDCHAKGIRVILDGVFNHSGITFPFFQDVLEKGPDSKYYDWFHIQEWPLQVNDGIPTYRTFAFERTMPKLNTANPEVKDYLLKLGRYWIEETDIDGWRLDVANEVDHAFWRDFRQAVKEVKADAYILGEVWHDGMMWLLGEQFDGVMNYPLCDAVLDFFVFGHDDAYSFAAKIGGYLARYPKQVTESLFNHLDTHDTARLLTLCKGDIRKMKLAVVFQFTYIGAPSIYYGDEIGLAGEFDPDNRRPMIWERERQNRELYDFYRTLAVLRRSHSALFNGEFRIRSAERDSNVLVYERQHGCEHLIVAMNRGSEQADVHVSWGSMRWHDVFGSEETQPIDRPSQHTLGAYEFRVWLNQEQDTCRTN
ncbi:alpha-glycosidase [Paenibacillus sp. YPG26]|uniref:alpha-glycosidase n=1 Tax=Paenibacillus sp. YPG26 TaxID=2878915 RepID=UPI00203EDDB1|nr:alpha-glycosidase [Paenibacillus sp. YPG26]USB34300.1 alpha-glycosidase [Paenibacillus sp. YPG26]